MYTKLSKLFICSGHLYKCLLLFFSSLDGQEAEKSFVACWYVCKVVVHMIWSPHPPPLTVTQALKFMMELEDDSDWSLSDEPEVVDRTR